jgi:polynucleotide 5'-hydroxyl-kinase GRC3/NOL9
MDDLNLDVPRSWKAIQPEELRGTLLVIGEPDTGKSKFARYLVEMIRSSGRETAFVDGDPGQSAFGPPTVLTMASKLGSGDRVFRDSQIRRYFVGSTTPQGHMLPTLVGAKRLVEVAEREKAHTIVYDTSGLVDPRQGGLALKSAKIDLLRPSAIFAIQREQELEPLLVPIRRSGRARGRRCSGRSGTVPSGRGSLPR